MAMAFLKLKAVSSPSQDFIIREDAICIDNQTYDFDAIFENTFPENVLNLFASTSNTLILAGSTNGAKLASLHEIIQYFSGTKETVHVSACDISKNSSFVDLINENSSRRFLTSTPIDSQLKKVILDSRRASRLMREIASPSSPSPSYSRSCVLVSLYRDSKVLTIVHIAGGEKLQAPTSGLALIQHMLAGTAGSATSVGGKSHNLVANMLLRRASSANLNIVMHLDTSGDSDTMKRSLECISQAMKTRSVSVKSVVKRSPHYARPTVSSASPSQTLSSFKVDKPLPKKRNAGLAGLDQIVVKRQMGSLRQVTKRIYLGSQSPETMSSEAASLTRSSSPNDEFCSETIKSLQNRVREAKAESLKASAEFAKTRSGFDELVGIYEEKKQLIESLKQEIAVNSAKNSSLESQISSLSSSLAEKNQEIEKMKEVSSMEKKDLASSFEAEFRQNNEAKSVLEKEIASLAESKSQLEKSLAEKIDEITRMETVWANERKELSSAFDTELKEKKQAVECLESKITSLVESKKELELSLTEKTKEVERMTKALSNEKKELALAFESELRQNQKDAAHFEEQIASLMESKAQLETQAAQVLEEKQHLETKVALVEEKLARVSNENNFLKNTIQDTQNSVSSREGSFKAMEARLREQTNKIQALEEQVNLKQSDLASKIATIEKQNTTEKQSAETIEHLKEQVQTEMKKSEQRERELHQVLQAEKEKSSSEISSLEKRVVELTNKVNKQKTIDANFKKVLNEKELALKDVHEFKSKCKRLEMANDELVENARQKNAEYENHVTQLNDELAKAKGSAVSPKKLHEFPDLDFSNPSNAFSSVDIFDDHTEYMNYFRRPGRSPIPSPTRVLTESNVQASMRSRNSSPNKMSSEHMVVPDVVEHEI